MAMKDHKITPHFFLLMLPFLGIVFFPRGLAGEEKFHLQYKPWTEASDYKIEIMARSELETSGGRVEGGRREPIIRKHKDRMSLELRMERGANGAVESVLTVKKINPLPRRKRKGRKGGGLRGTIGTQYKRSEIVGNSQKITMDAQGNIRTATGIPHFASRGYKRGEDGPPLDMYRVLLMLHPRFPKKMVGKGDRWKVNDEVWVKEAEVTETTSGVMPLNFRIDGKIKRRLTYTLVGFGEKKGYQTAQIRFEGRFSSETEGEGPSGGYHKSGGGKVSGELFFAPTEGKVVELVMDSKVTEAVSRFGTSVTFWLNPRERLFLDVLEGRTHPPLLWRTDQKVRFELVDSEKAGQAS